MDYLKNEDNSIFEGQWGGVVQGKVGRRNEVEYDQVIYIKFSKNF